MFEVRDQVYSYRWVILIVTWLAYLVMYLQRFAIPPLSPFIKEEFLLSGTQVGMLMAANALGYAAMQMPAGWLVDRIGVRWMLLIGEVFAGVMVFCMFFTPSYRVSLVLLGLEGLGCGCLLTSTSKAIMVWFPVRERATAMGLKQTATNLGGVTAAVTLPTLAIALGWRYGFAVIGIIEILVGILSFILYKEHPGEKDGTRETGSKSLDGSVSLVRDVFLNREILLLGCVGIFFAIIEFSAITHMVLYLKETFFFTAVLAGGLLAVFEGAGAFGKPLFGLISDRLFGGKRKKTYFLMAIISFGMCLVMAFSSSAGASKWTLVPVLVVFGLAANGWAGVHFAFVGECADRKAMGLGIGFAVAIGAVGNIVGPPLFGYIVDVSKSYKPAWLFLAFCALAIMALVIPVREHRRKI